MKVRKFFESPSTARLLQGAAMGALLGTLLTVVLGFNMLGFGFSWYTGSGATKLAYSSAHQAEARVLTPICAEWFRANATPEQIASLNTPPSYSRGDVLKRVVKILNHESFDYLLINSCADAVLAANTKSAQR
jgi:hypothetical protein